MRLLGFNSLPTCSSSCWKSLPFVSNGFCMSSKCYNTRNIRAQLSEESNKQKPVGDWMDSKDPYQILGVAPGCSQEEVKAAFRARVKEYHPDVYKGTQNVAPIIQRVIGAYETLVSDVQEIKRGAFDPFDSPECVAEEVFVNELLCIGRGCPYSCVARAPQVFKFSSDTGCACAISQVGTIEYGVQLAVGQCPRNCIYYVTPFQRAVLEDLLRRALEGTIYSSEVAMLEALLARANFENGRYTPTKRKPKGSNEMVDWF